MLVNPDLSVPFIAWCFFYVSLRHESRSCIASSLHAGCGKRFLMRQLVGAARPS